MLKPLLQTYDGLCKNCRWLIHLHLPNLEEMASNSNFWRKWQSNMRVPDHSPAIRSRRLSHLPSRKSWGRTFQGRAHLERVPPCGLAGTDCLFPLLASRHREAPIKLSSASPRAYRRHCHLPVLRRHCHYSRCGELPFCLLLTSDSPSRTSPRSHLTYPTRSLP
jgi:hypothetical protein